MKQIFMRYVSSTLTNPSEQKFSKQLLLQQLPTEQLASFFRTISYGLITRSYLQWAVKHMP